MKYSSLKGSMTMILPFDVTQGQMLSGKLKGRV